ncbi:Hypothetical protein D9617_27g045370 [Elsinoe fawcettii]|nr:Hypothetical protein D9617_27g045370 [Elsinoe fawcettii]
MDISSEIGSTGDIFKFQKLPPEIRDMIYSSAIERCTSRRHIVKINRSDGKSSIVPSPDLLHFALTHKEAYYHIKDSLWSASTFCMEMISKSEHGEWWFSPPTERLAAHNVTHFLINVPIDEDALAHLPGTINSLSVITSLTSCVVNFSAYYSSIYGSMDDLSTQLESAEFMMENEWMDIVLKCPIRFSCKAAEPPEWIYRLEEAEEERWELVKPLEEDEEKEDGDDEAGAEEESE